jgi:hypothetical protein
METITVVALVLGGVLTVGLIVILLQTLTRGKMGFRNVARTLPAMRRSAASDPQAGVRRGSNVGRMDMREVRLQG